jgi:CRP-like cAMP-binding protein
MDCFTFLKQIHPSLTEKQYGSLSDKMKPRTFRKGDTLVNPGEIQRELYFVRSGVQMSFFESADKTHVIAFTYAPNLCAIPGSLSLQKPSNCYLTCLTDSEMDVISFEELHNVLAEERNLETLFLRLTEAILVGVISRHIDLHSKTMVERFREFCQRSPHLLHTVPHKYIASYLGIDPTNFSKLYNSVRI